MALSTLSFRRGAELARRWPLVWHARELTIDALTGQVGTLTRAATAAALDLNGTSRTLSYHQPRWEYVSGVGTCLRLGAAAGALTEYLSWPADIVLSSAQSNALCGMISFVENGTSAIGDASGGGAALWGMSNAAVTTGAYLTVHANSTSGLYTIGHDNDVSSVVSVLGAAPSSGNRVRLRWWLYSDGRVQIWQSINGAAETAASVSGTLTMSAPWGTATKYWLNSLGTAGLAYGHVLVDGLVVGLGNQSQADLLEALA